MFHIFLYINQISFLYIKIGFSNYESMEVMINNNGKKEKKEDRKREREKP